MTVDIAVQFTDYDWNTDSRPVLSIDKSGTNASIFVGKNIQGLDLPNIEITCVTPEDMLLCLEGYRDIFNAAIEHLTEKNKDAV